MDNTDEIVNKCFEAVQAKMIPKDYINTDFLMEHGIKGIWEEAINTALIAIKHANDNNGISALDDVDETNGGNIYVCSCGYGWDKSTAIRHHYCPNCGTKATIS